MKEHELVWTLLADPNQEGVVPDFVGLVVQTCDRGLVATVLMTVDTAGEVAKAGCPACAMKIEVPALPFGGVVA